MKWFISIFFFIVLFNNSYADINVEKDEFLSSCVSYYDTAISQYIPQYINYTGIASKYPGDIGIENDSDVIFVAQFEESTLTEVFEHWEDIGGKDIMSLTNDVPPKSPGKNSIAMTHIGGGTGGQLWTRFPKGNGLGGYDRLYLRYYVKFSIDHHEIHHMSGLSGYFAIERYNYNKRLLFNNT